MSLCQLVCSTSSERLLEFWSQILLTVSASGFLVLVSDSNLVLGSVESRSLSSWVRWSTDFLATLWRAVAFLVVAARAVWRFWLVFSEKSVRVCSTYNCKKILLFKKCFLYLEKVSYISSRLNHFVQHIEMCTWIFDYMTKLFLVPTI